MPFTPEKTPEAYIASPPPVLEGSMRIHYERELRAIQRVMTTLKEAIEEIQEHLDTP